MSTTVARQHPFYIYYLSERALTIEFGQQIALHLLDAVNKFNTLLHQQPFAGFETTIPAYTTLTVLFDPVLVNRSGLPGKTCFEKAAAYLRQLNTQQKKAGDRATALVTIPVCYGGDYGADLEEVARLHQMDLADVIKLHSQAVYKVYMIGFVPGFAYLGGMDERLETPRKTSPRKNVPAGSVGIAGKQTGIYPMQTPGGWQLIGRTPLRLFDAGREIPSLLKAGDEVKFKPITEPEFNQLAAG